MPRQRLVIGNWKMHTTRPDAVALAAGVVAGLADLAAWDAERVVIGLAPPFPFLAPVGELLAGHRVELVAQDCHTDAQGAFTGCVSAPMLRSVGVARAIVGHSERRHKMGETDALVRRKLEAALAHGLGPVLCVGELLEERDAGRAEEVVRAQVLAGLEGLGPAQLERVVVAYEPVWAIGTGRVATPAQVETMHALVRSTLDGLCSDRRPPILYGGSVKPDNAEELARTPGVNGFLVGGASLDAGSFLGIIRPTCEVGRRAGA